jgi:hypothetical protein
MQAWRCHAKLEVSIGEWEQAGCGEATLLLYWRRILEEAATSGISMREFCRQRRWKETQFYWWRRMLKSGGQERRVEVERPVERERGSFALVSEEVGAMTADLELVLRDGRRLQIGRGVEEESYERF